MTEDFRKSYRELQESGGISSVKDLTAFVDRVDGLLAAAEELTRLRAIEAKFDALSGDNFIATLAAATAERDAIRAAKDARIKECEEEKKNIRESVRSAVIDALNRHSAPMEACQDVVDSIDTAISAARKGEE